MTLRLLDVSSNNGPVDMAQVAAAGVSGVLLKCTEGTGYFDPPFLYNWDAAGKAGLFRAAYCFLHMDLSPEAQADYFLAHLPPLGVGDGVAGDFEWPLSMTGDLSPQTLTWLSRVEGHVGFKPLAYSFVDYINRHLQAPGLGKYPLWLASWGTWLPPAIASWPSVALWQDSDHSLCPGVNGPVDESLIARDLAGLRALGKPSPVPLPPPPSLYPTGPVYKVATAHYLRVLPRVAAPHAEVTFMEVGELCDANAAPPAGLPSWSTAWRWVKRRKTEQLGYLYAPDAVLPGP